MVNIKEYVTDTVVTPTTPKKLENQIKTMNYVAKVLSKLDDSDGKLTTHTLTEKGIYISLLNFSQNTDKKVGTIINDISGKNLTSLQGVPKGNSKYTKGAIEPNWAETFRSSVLDEMARAYVYSQSINGSFSSAMKQFQPDWKVSKVETNFYVITKYTNTTISIPESELVAEIKRLQARNEQVNLQQAKL